MKALLLVLCLLLGACAGADIAPQDVVSQLAPTGRLRAAMARDDPIAPELARSLARRLGVPLATTSFDASYDVAFALPEAARAGQLDFTSPYVVLDGRPRVIALPRGRPQAGDYLRDFVDELRDSGAIAEAIERRGARKRASVP
jgi:hypothetical protein